MLGKDTDWNKKATKQIKAEMLDCGVNYQELTDALNKIGVDKNMKNVRKTIWMGRFPHSFYLQIKSALGSISKDS